MSPEELASKELAAWRRRENRHVRTFITLCLAWLSKSLLFNHGANFTKISQYRVQVKQALFSNTYSLPSLHFSLLPPFSSFVMFPSVSGWPYILPRVEWSHLSILSAEMTTMCRCAQLPLFLNLLKTIQLFLFYVWTFCLYVFHMHALSEEGVCFKVSFAMMEKQDQSPRGGKSLSWVGVH